MENDDRFKGIATDPRFRALPARFRKVKIDKRFKGMFKDKQFKVKCTVDERGRPVKLSSNKHLKKFYDLSSSEEEESDGDEEKATEKEADDESERLAEISAGSESQDDSEDGEEQDAITDIQAGLDSKAKMEKKKMDKERKRKKKSKAESQKTDSESESSDEEEDINAMQDYARGVVLHSSSDDSDSDDEEVTPLDQEAHGDHYWGEHDQDAESTEEATNRLAIQNMDWDRIKAYDLLMLLNSFKPATGTVHSVKIYKSEFGKEKMAQDELTGPKELKNARLNDEGEAEGRLKHLNEKDQKQAMLENLRQYQLNRLKYYYAVAELDSAETANHIYTTCDGQEYLASCTQLDLRFVPDDMEFDDGDLKESANHIPDNYEPNFFINPALGQSLVRCTWDENAPDRYNVLNKKYKASDLEELDMQAYLASDSEEEAESSDKPKAMKAGNNNTVKRTTTKERKAEKATADLQVQEESGSERDSEDEDEDSLARYRQLLLGGDNSKTHHKSGGDNEADDHEDEDIDMEITWDTGLKDTAEGILKKKSKSKDKGDKSVFEREREKKREKAKKLKADKKAESKALSESAKDVNTKTKKSKSKSADEEEYNVAFSDDDVGIPAGFTADDLLDDSDSEGDNSTNKVSKSINKKKQKKGKKIKDEPSGETDDPTAGNETTADLDLMLMDEKDDSNRKHFNIKEIAEYENMTKSKRKRKLKKNQLKTIEDDFTIDVKDDRFKAMYSSHLYNIDPSSQDFRKTKAMEALISEKQRMIQNSERNLRQPGKRKQDSDNVSKNGQSKAARLSTTEKSTGKTNISSLVKSVKAKTQKHTTKQSRQNFNKSKSSRVR